MAIQVNNSSNRLIQHNKSYQIQVPSQGLDLKTKNDDKKCFPLSRYDGKSIQSREQCVKASHS